MLLGSGFPPGGAGASCRNTGCMFAVTFELSDQKLLTVYVLCSPEPEVDGVMLDVVLADKESTVCTM